MNFIKIGPFENSRSPSIQIYDILIHKYDFPKEATKRVVQENGLFYYLMEISRNNFNFINSDFRMDVSGSGVSFEFWANLWHSCLRVIKKFFDSHKEEFKTTKFLEEIIEKEKNMVFEISKYGAKCLLEYVEMKELGDNIDSQRNLYTKGELSERQEKNLRESVSLGRQTTIRVNEEIKDNELLEEEVNDFNIISKIFLKSNQKCNLNEIVDKMNYVCEKIGIKSINKNDLNIFIKADELDKFGNAKKMLKDFGVSINYSLLDK